MPRGKVKIQYIENKSVRNETLKRRLRTLVKMVRELSILCQVAAFLVLYHPDKEMPAAVWPSMTQAIAIARQYKSINSEKLKNALDGQGFLQQQVDKERGKLQNLQRTAETKRCLHDICVRRDSLKLHGQTLTPEVIGEVRNGLNLQVITEVQCKLQSRLRAVSDRLKEKRSGSTSAAPLPEEVPMLAPVVPSAMVAPGAVPPIAPMEIDPPHVADDEAPMTSIGGFSFDDLLTPEELRDD